MPSLRVVKSAPQNDADATRKTKNKMLTEINKTKTNIVHDLQQKLVEAQNEIRSLRADLIHIQNEQENQRIASIHGKGVTFTNDNVNISKAEYERMLPAKLASHSIEEVCQMIAASAGVSTDTNSDEFARYFQIDDKSLEKARIERMRRKQ